MRYLLLCLLFWVPLFAGGKAVPVGRDIVVASYTVGGNCDQCKKRIEDAAYVKGVKFAEWNVDTHSLVVKYDSSKTTPLTILQNVAAAGHDNELVKATDAAYNQLPDCCRYREATKKH